MAGQPGVMPSSVTPDVGLFDRFADWASRTVSRAWFFGACVLLVVVWAPSYFLFGSIDTWQLVINTVTTIITFLLVALLQNSQQRGDQATQHKLNAVAQGLAELLADGALRAGWAGDPGEAGRLQDARRELCAAVGLELRETS
jgi:cytochrome c-type biogenesis protein CcmH/NrfG